MVPTQEGQKLKCEKCGNEVMVLKIGGGDLTCCGGGMQLLQEDGVEEGDA